MPIQIPTVVAIPTATDRKLYFDNNKVEDLLVKYVWTGCTRVELRDQIMKNAEELIRQIIMAHNLHRIYPGQEDSAFGDLFQTAWIQIERTLYKYKARPHCAACYNIIRPQDSVLYNPADDEYGIIKPKIVAERGLTCPSCGNKPPVILYRGTSKVFNMWSQVARTVILAYIKKENRDYKNSDAYKVHLGTRYESTDGAFQRFVDEANNICKHNKNHMIILEALKHIAATDDRPYEGIISKLVRYSNQSRAQVTGFLKLVRLRSDEFTDSPVNERPKPRYTEWAEQSD
jgi:hypothetical protein